MEVGLDCFGPLVDDAVCAGSFLYQLRPVYRQNMPGSLESQSSPLK